MIEVAGAILKAMNRDGVAALVLVCALLAVLALYWPVLRLLNKQPQPILNRDGQPLVDVYGKPLLK